jgi:hypothetical protein
MMQLNTSIGYVSAYGVFRQWYFQNPPFQGNQILAEIGVLSVVCSHGCKGPPRSTVTDVD